MILAYMTVGAVAWLLFTNSQVTLGAQPTQQNQNRRDDQDDADNVFAKLGVNPVPGNGPYGYNPYARTSTAHVRYGNNEGDIKDYTLRRDFAKGTSTLKEDPVSAARKAARNDLEQMNERKQREQDRQDINRMAKRNKF